MKNIPLLLFLFLAFSIKAQENNDSVKILLIGNSYTYYHEMPTAIRTIASTQNLKWSCTRVCPGGYSFTQHLQNKETVAAIQKGGWDYVILQEHSLAPARATEEVTQTVYPAASSLDSMIHVHSPKAKVVFYMTWGRKDGYEYEWNGAKYSLINSYEGMQQRLITSYLEMAYMNRAWCAPVGMAWQRVRKERPGYILYTPDRSHPSVLGSYLAANVIFTVIYQRRYQTDFTMGIPPEQAEYIQQTAQQTVFENLELLNIK
jgi:hypothetical protein